MSLRKRFSELRVATTLHAWDTHLAESRAAWCSEDVAMTITGGCLCRAVRYTATAEPVATRVCWCRDCQHLAAGSPTVNLVFMTSAVTIERTAA